MAEFAKPRPKTYSYLVDDNSGEQKSKRNKEMPNKRKT